VPGVRDEVNAYPEPVEAISKMAPKATPRIRKKSRHDPSLSSGGRSRRSFRGEERSVRDVAISCHPPSAASKVEDPAEGGAISFYNAIATHWAFNNYLPLW